MACLGEFTPDQHLLVYTARKQQTCNVLARFSAFMMQAGECSCLGVRSLPLQMPPDTHMHETMGSGGPLTLLT